LVEEASIGVDTGPPEYMLGGVGGMWITDDEIYLIDRQVPIVRVYDWSGAHLRDIGGAGQGPGEYERPGNVLVGADGRVYVSEGGGSPRINVYSREGESLETWRWGGGATRMLSGSLMMRHDGVLLTSAYIMPDPSEITPGAIFEPTMGMQQVGRDGGVGDLMERPDLEVERIRISLDERRSRPVPYSPGQISTFSPAGAWIVGDNHSYSFEIRYPDGHIVKAHRYWDPVPIEAEHADYLRRRTISSARRSLNSTDWSWSGREIPEYKPAYYSFYTTQGNRVLVVREGPSHLVDGCDPYFDLNEGPQDDCYRPERTWDMFDLEGNYLGEVIRPRFARLFLPFWRDDALLLVVEDELGTVMLKRFRFELPADAEES